MEQKKCYMVLPLTYAICNVSLAPVKGEPAHRAEQVNQLLFGERVEISETGPKEWVKIHGLNDGYVGWCKQSQLRMVDRKEFRKGAKYLAGSHNDKLLIDQGDMWLPLGSELTGMKGGKLSIGVTAGKFKGKKLKIDKGDAESLVAAAMKYMHAPYQWGGKTVAGIDCSGLTQMAFKLCGRNIPRDASQQANEGALVDFLQNARRGDLAFFDNKEGKIVHVGLLMDTETIIHSTETSGRTVIDKIDQGGIISRTLRMRTHNLRFVKRLV